MLLGSRAKFSPQELEKPSQDESSKTMTAAEQSNHFLI
jgi:hypothetical protein